MARTAAVTSNGGGMQLTTCRLVQEQERWVRDQLQPHVDPLALATADAPHIFITNGLIAYLLQMEHLPGTTQTQALCKVLILCVRGWFELLIPSQAMNL